MLYAGFSKILKKHLITIAHLILDIERGSLERFYSRISHIRSVRACIQFLESLRV